ncbi:ABC transporter permease [Nesterenkonia alkaliphila]|uniref:Transport permease protein n=1 Tax=Nesterenkonia alkaliphila TaxID=1463631 RepID=A0A7K1UJI4_9MICC|nr:ABC transporter permease [Nesterenkonia alkaliphila]MVT26492.1 ABC transporter permease [Nesterenkonia alkaliphila]GFZ88705.1 transport permease protein [Nesterenkonia alkaliphila]
MNTPIRTLKDSAVIAERNLVKVKRVPVLLVYVLLSPIMFVLLFSFVFGGAIELGDGSSYREFLMGGVFAMTVLFGGIFTASGLAEDMQKGLIDRFRSLPMSHAAVLIGRTASDVSYNILSLIVMGLTGLLVGWRVQGSLLDALAGFALLLVFAYAFSWIMAYIGLLVPSPEVVNNSSYLVIMPLTFLSNAFVPLESFSGLLRHIVEWNPVSALTQAARELFGNTDPSALASTAWSMEHPVAYTLIWTAALVVVFLPLSVRQYRRATG